MTPVALLAELRRLGLEVKAHSQALRIGPANRLPEELKAEVRIHKTALLHLLAVEVEPSSEDLKLCEQLARGSATDRPGPELDPLAARLYQALRDGSRDLGWPAPPLAWGQLGDGTRFLWRYVARAASAALLPEEAPDGKA